MGKFACNFDALEIEAHKIVFNEEIDETHRYEPWDFKEDGPRPDVWSVFGHAAGNPTEPGEGRELIADCETAEAAEFIAELVRDRIIRNAWDSAMRAGKKAVPPEVPVYWYTERPE